MSIYVVTGGAGFIGGHLVHSLLSDGHDVRVVDDLSTGHREVVPSAASLTVADVNDADAMAEALDGAAGCFHLAAVASVDRCRTDWLGAHGVNLRGTLTVFEQAVKAGVPVVYASSAAVYGDPACMPVDEDTPTRPLSAYGADKLACELHARAGGSVHGLRSCGLRFFNVFGPGQDPSSPYSGVVSIFADRLSRGLPLTIHGDGGQTRDFVFVGDVVRALRAAESAAAVDGPVSNVCTGRATTVRDLAEGVARVLGVTAQIDHGPARPGDIRLSLGCPRRMEGLLEVSARTDLLTGLSAMLDSTPVAA